MDSRIKHVTLITNPANENTSQFVKAIRAAAEAQKISVRVASVVDPADIQDAIETCSKQPDGGLVIFPDSLLILHHTLIIELAERYKLPAVYPLPGLPRSGWAFVVWHKLQSGLPTGGRVRRQNTQGR